MYSVDKVSQLLNPVEQTFQQGDLKPLLMCLDCILAKKETSEFVRNPLAAARVVNLLDHPESITLGVSRVRKVIELLVQGPLRFGREIINLSLKEPQHVQDAVVSFLERHSRRIEGKYTQDQMVDILKFALKVRNPILFEKVSYELFGLHKIGPDGNSVVIVPELLPVYLEKSSRGAFLRDHCHGLKLNKQCNEQELLHRYLPRSIRSHLNTLWVSSYDFNDDGSSITLVYQLAGPIRRLIIHSSFTPELVEKLLLSLPDVKEVVFDHVTWSDGYSWGCSYNRCFPQKYYELLKNFAVSIRNVDIYGEIAIDNLSKIVNLPEIEGEVLKDITIEHEAMETVEEELIPVETRDRMVDSSSNLLPYFCPDIIDDIEAGITWPLDHILAHVSEQICYEAIKIPELCVQLFRYAETKFEQGKISLETVSSLVSKARVLNHYKKTENVNFFLDPRCETNVLTKELEWISLPTLPLMVETRSPKPLEKFSSERGGFQIPFSSAVLKAFGTWLGNTDNDVNITSQVLIDLDLLATQLGIYKIRERYTSEALKGLDEVQVETLLNRVSKEEQLQLVQKASSDHPKEYNGGLYLKPQRFLNLINNPSPWKNSMMKWVKGVVLDSYNTEGVVELVVSPNALACIRDIYVDNVDSLYVLGTFSKFCANLERIVIHMWTSLKHDHLEELTRLNGNLTLLFDSVNLQNDGQKWVSLDFDERLRVVFQNVKLKLDEKRDATLLHANSSYMEDARVVFLND